MPKRLYNFLIYIQRIALRVYIDILERGEEKKITKITERRIATPIGRTVRE